MPRRARGKILYDSCYAHIYSRALGKKRIFAEAEDFEAFKQMLLWAKGKYGFRIHHYCLMHTHFHLAVSMDKACEFSKALKALKQGYAKRMQEERKIQGPVWWGRFGSRVIEDEKYMYACGLYIEMNPVKAGLAERPEEWEHSSAQYYFAGKADVIVDDYEKPGYETALELAEAIDFEKARVIGSDLFKIYSRDC